MPIFEYTCRNCSHRFEALVVNSEAKPACESCGSRALTKNLSVFSAASSTGHAPAPCTGGTCGTGDCASGACPFA